MDVRCSVQSCGREPLVLFRRREWASWCPAVAVRSDSDWDIFWADVGWIREKFDNFRMDDHQRINHFRNHYELTRKDLLVKNVKRMKKQMEREDRYAEADKYEFVPLSFALPGDYSAFALPLLCKACLGLFVEAFKRHPGETWIMKPIGRAQGKGIFLFNRLSQISEWKRDHRWRADAPQQAESYIVQRYISDPYTIGGKKFDCRLYVLVTSFSPLTVWLYRSGFARFTFARYEHTKESQGNLEMHLTNVSIQKRLDAYKAAQACKLSLRQLKLYMASEHGLPLVNRLFKEIEGMIIRSLLAVQKSIIQDKHSFELYGYDIMFDKELRPWLLEVNASPALTADNDADYQLKYGLIDDTMNVLDLEERLDGTQRRVGGFDLIFDGRPLELEGAPPSVETPLGLFNEREKTMADYSKRHRGPASNAEPSVAPETDGGDGTTAPTAAAAAGAGGADRQR